MRSFAASRFRFCGQSIVRNPRDHNFETIYWPANSRSSSVRMACRLTALSEFVEDAQPRFFLNCGCVLASGAGCLIVVDL